MAVGTAAGTNITNTATVDYSIGGTPATTTSNTTTVAVAEIVNVTITLQSPTVSVAAGATNEALLFLVTNTGNSVETFALAGDSVLVGDDFDPMPASPFIYFDTRRAAATCRPATRRTSPGATIPRSRPTRASRCCSSTTFRRACPTATAAAASCAQRPRRGPARRARCSSGQGSGGVDAVIGTSGGVGAVFGEYLVGDIQLSAVKSQTVLDPFGGSQPVPGAAIAIQVVVTATGTGTAVGAAFTDAVPANTTYVAGSLTLNGAPLTDAADADAGSFATAPARVVVSLGDLTAAAGPQTVVFRVTID